MAQSKLIKNAVLAVTAAMALVNGPLQGQLTTPKFEVVSVKPCDPKAVASGERGAVASPGRLRADCQSLLRLIESAYVTYADGRVNPPWTVPTVVSTGAPDWIKSERFTIEAKGDGAPPYAVLWGPMLQAALEDRFRLKTHRDRREVPVYELVVGRTGAKLTPFQPGACVPFDWSSYPSPPLDPGQRRCANKFEVDRGTGNQVRNVEAMTLDDMADSFNGFDRSMINKTGITGLVAFRLVYESDNWSPGDPPPPSLITTLVAWVNSPRPSPPA